jgi:FixJ family two-component response regulator
MEQAPPGCFAEYRTAMDQAISPVHRSRKARERSRRRDGHLHREEPAAATPKLVSVVDDDESVRESLPDLLKELGFATRAFASAEEFLASDCLGETRCLLLDIALPVMSGPELQQELILRGHSIPTIFITAHADENVRPRLLKQGAVECLFKPFSEQDLRAAIRAAGV